MAAPPPAALPEVLVQEILARLPPDDPACLLRAFLVCKAWGHAVSHPGFQRRLHELHQAPPLLGFLPNRASHSTPYFIPTTASSFSLDAPDCHSWRAVDCRHGRALFHSVNQDPETLLVWEPITGAQNRLPVPAAYDTAKPHPKALMYSNAAVFCAADRCDHRGCLGGPFRVVFIFEEHTKEEQDLTSACVYSAETGAWGELTSLHTRLSIQIAEGANVIFVNSVAGVFTIELQSEEVRKVFVDSGFGNLVPVVTFYTPVLPSDQQYLLVSKPSWEAGSEEGREGEKRMDQAQHLFDKGSNATNEGDFVNTFECISLDHDTGVPRYGEVTLRSVARSTNMDVHTKLKR